MCRTSYMKRLRRILTRLCIAFDQRFDFSDVVSIDFFPSHLNLILVTLSLVYTSNLLWQLCMTSVLARVNVQKVFYYRFSMASEIDRVNGSHISFTNVAEAAISFTRANFSMTIFSMTNKNWCASVWANVFFIDKIVIWPSLHEQKNLSKKNYHRKIALIIKGIAFFFYTTRCIQLYTPATEQPKTDLSTL